MSMNALVREQDDFIVLQNRAWRGDVEAGHRCTAADTRSCFFFDITSAVPVGRTSFYLAKQIHHAAIVIVLLTQQGKSIKCALTLPYYCVRA